jgi:hypothetical protein
MFQVPNSAPHSRPWPLVLLWMSIALIGVLASSLIFPLIYRVFGSSVSDIRMISAIMSMFNGLVVIVLQWLVLRRYFPGMYRWVPVLGGILAAATLLQGITYTQAAALIAAFGRSIRSAALIENADSAAALAVYVFWTLVSATAGWWIFRPLTRRAWLWPAALLLGALGQSLISVTVLWPLLRGGGSSFSLSTYSLITVMFTLATAAIQAAVLVTFLRERQRPGAGLPTQLEY